MITLATWKLVVALVLSFIGGAGLAWAFVPRGSAPSKKSEQPKTRLEELRLKNSRGKVLTSQEIGCLGELMDKRFADLFPDELQEIEKLRGRLTPDEKKELEKLEEEAQSKKTEAGIL